MWEIELENPNLEELCYYFTEQSFALYELQIRMWHKIGSYLKIHPEQIKPFAKRTHKHLSEVQTAVAFAEKYPNIEDFPGDKATTWAKVKEMFALKETRKRRPIVKILKERQERHKKRLEETQDSLAKAEIVGRIKEDEELAKE